MCLRKYASGGVSARVDENFGCKVVAGVGVSGSARSLEVRVMRSFIHSQRPAIIQAEDIQAVKQSALEWYRVSRSAPHVTRRPRVK